MAKGTVLLQVSRYNPHDCHCILMTHHSYFQ